MNEWNNVRDVRKNGTSYASAATAAMICAMQDSNTHILCYYDARLTLSPYGGFFDGATHEPLCTYYVFDAFNQLYTLKNQTECVCDPSVEGLYAVAAADGEKKALMIVNHSEEIRTIQTNLAQDFTLYLLDEKHFLTPVDAKSDEFTLEPNQIMLLKNN